MVCHAFLPQPEKYEIHVKTRFPAHFNLLHIKIDLNFENEKLLEVHSECTGYTVRACRM